MAVFKGSVIKVKLALTISFRSLSNPKSVSMCKLCKHSEHPHSSENGLSKGTRLALEELVSLTLLH